MKEKKFQYFFEVSVYKKILKILICLLLIISLILLFYKKYLVIGMVLLFGVIQIKTIKNIFKKDAIHNKMYKKTIKEGQKYTGKIIGYKKNNLLKTMINIDLPNNNNIDQEIHSLIIEYNGTTFETPTIVYNAEKLFATFDCDVYVLNDYQYATNFKLATNEYIELPEIKGDDYE